MKIKCKYCGNIVVEGEIVERENRKGNIKRVFDIFQKPQGTILKNKSNNPNDWTGVCSKCQKSLKEKK
jgi:hypothetical protein